MLITRKRARRAPRPRGTDGAKRAKRGRPMKRAVELSASRSVARRHIEQVYSQQMASLAHTNRNRLSTLESLPVELIQQIFFYSLDVNMARSSSYLTSILSKPQIYTALILFAYFDDDLTGPVESQHFRPAEYRYLSVEDRIALQSAILSCKWCTLQRIKSCLPILSRLKMVQAQYTEAEQEDSLLLGEETNTQTPQVPNEKIRQVASLPSSEDQTAMEEHFLAKWDLNKVLESNDEMLQATGEQGFLPRIRTWTSSVDESGQLYKTLTCAPSILAARVIPDWLLENSNWTKTRLELLQLLRQGLRFLQNDNVLLISSDALFSGMTHAIIEQRPDVLRILLELHFGVMREHYQPGDGAWSSEGRLFATPSAHPLPLELFHLACKQDKSSELLSLLIREGIDSIPLDDDVLTSWAVQARERKDQLGVWLLAHMIGNNEYGLRLNEPLFINGNLSWRREAGDYPFPEESFTDEIGYVYEGAEGLVPENPGGGPCG